VLGFGCGTVGGLMVRGVPADSALDHSWWRGQSGDVKNSFDRILLDFGRLC
jgi:hypothetical protein